ncbi:MAG: homoserine kinase [Candidatus Cloacimonetes bacterium]|jgi:homoserine kinase|nr:homoserine kinase [Candidatus Cloacimonadota bacterium]MBT6993573.1 homoserine kinase [Candidatus Cloacimonadota bacterium]MBT7469335.1 homoserine kinase [Candidatus Cloacimonadota bacterium]
MKKIRLSAPATIANVGPGYDIFAMALENPRDEFEISLNDSGKITIEIENNTENIPLDVNKNTAGLAILEFQKKFNLSDGVHVKIFKKIHSGGGMGTTGASASACVFGLNKLLKMSLTSNEMINIAQMGEIASGGSPHADNVAAAMLGGFTLVRNYNPIEIIKLDLPVFPIVFAAIRKSERTTRGKISYQIGEEKLKEQIAYCSRVIHAIHTQDIAEFGAAISVDHIAEPVRAVPIPNYFEAKRKILEAGAFGCNVSGGGSSVFAVCSEDKQTAIAQIMFENFSKSPHFVEILKTKTTNFGVQEISDSAR